MSPTSSPDDAFPLIERERVTWTTLVPSVVDLWTEARQWHRGDLSSLRLVQVGGAVFRPESARRATQGLGCGLQQVYGMAEGLLTMTALDDPDDLVLTTQGRPPCPADEVRLVDQDGVDVEAGAVGELWTRGPYTVRGYFRAPQSSDESFTPDGLYRTGDLARRLPSGHLVIQGRLKDVINRGGDKIPCEELEGHLLAHPAISAAAAVPVADPGLGERVCAFLVSEQPQSLREIRAFLQARGVASFKFPDRLEYVDRLPLTKIGKIDRKVLVARAAGSAAGA
jgi:2,3-dihydroxybenzoate-AMP ligase